MARNTSTALRAPPLHVHLENLSTKERIYWLTPDLVPAARRRHRDLTAQRVRVTVGEDFTNLTQQLKTAHVLLISADGIKDPRFPQEAFAAAPQLKLVQLIGAGVEGLFPFDWLPPHIQLATASGVHVEKAREFLLMALLALNFRLPEILRNQRRAHWDMIFTPLIRRKILSVIGLGDMGRAAVAVGRTLGLKVIGVRRSGKRMAGVERVYRPREIVSAVRDADFIVVAAPLTAESRNLLSRDVLRKTKRGVGIVNVGRAGLVDYGALAALLRSGHVSGAILDVFSPEPLPKSSKLWSTPNAILTPHVSSDDLEGYMHNVMDVACENIRRLLARRPLTNVVDRESGY
jgi:phosphoglycerate dehydrogenase-like enzyme